MPATIRIDFDVHAESISDALKNELAKIQGVIQSSNNAIQQADLQRISKTANDEIKTAKETVSTIQKEKEKQDAYLLNLRKRSLADAEKAENAATKEAEREREKTEKYLLSVRMNSIKAANAAQEKADKEHLAEIKKEEAEQKRANSEHKARLKEIVGVVAVAEGLNVLVEKAKEASEYAVKMQTAFGTGEGLKAAKEDARKLGEQFGQTEMQAGATLAKIKAATASTGATQEEVIKLTQAATAMEAAGLPVSAKQLATEKGRQHILEVGGPLIANAMRAAQDPARQAQLAIAQVQETIGEIAKVVLDALGPALKAVTPILGQLGEIIGTIIKPLFEKLTPIIGLIGKTFADLTPIITELISTAMEVLTPVIEAVGKILADTIPPIMGIVKAVMDALMPVFKAIMPVVNEIINIWRELFQDDMNKYIAMFQDIFVPLLKDLVVPILMSLIPVIKMIADIFQSTVVPAIKIFNGILQFLMGNIIQPLIKWLSGGLVSAINSVIEVVTAAIKVVNAVVGAFKSLLGMGDDAAVAATKKTVTAVNAEEQKGLDTNLEQYNVHIAKKEKKVKDHSAQVRKSFIDEQQAMIDLGEETYAEAIESLQKYYDKLKETNIKGRRDVSNAIEKYRTAEYTEDKAAEDRKLKLQELSLVQEGMNDEDFKEAREALEIQHLQNLMDIAEKDGQDTLDLQLQLDNAKIAQAKRVNKEIIDNANATKDKLLQDAKDLSDQAEKDRIKELNRIKQLNAARMSQIQTAENVYGGMSEITKMTQSANHNATLLEKVDATAKAGALMVEAIANIIANSAELGPFGVITAPATIAAAVAMFAAAKTDFGFEQGGFTGYGKNNEIAGVVHKNEYVMKAGSFAVDSQGRLVQPGGHDAAILDAIHKQTEVTSKSTVINQRRMVLENKVTERSRSRESV